MTGAIVHMVTVGVRLTVEFSLIFAEVVCEVFLDWRRT